MKNNFKLKESEIVDLGIKSFSEYIKTMSKEELVGLLIFIYGYKLGDEL